MDINELKSMFSNNQTNEFFPSYPVAEGYKYSFEVEGKRIQIMWHSPDLAAKALWPKGNSGNKWTAQITVGDELLGFDGKFYKSLNYKTHIPVKF